ncbi:Cytosolic Fe-S cluster assembly factor NUBP2-like [Oopsacas minuta]|uniref:Cytosolic Fe-S cluster assembly factor NUBP2-like n=1 Tax=Oopsacas minuta TaxID=111878 RepID=A0AAV7JCT8_9METZ|nr:Cytosolic Fe-S cluster assembly factor NUBP2-like [Oopsacas minuta]
MAESREDRLGECPADTEFVGKADICKGCPGRDYCSKSSGIDPDQKFIDVRMNAIRNKILIMSAKGGVGKSTLVTCLAISLAKNGSKVGVIDLDICGPSIPLMLGIKHENIIHSEYGWKPIISPYFGIKVVSSQSLLESSDSAVVWRGPRKTNLVKTFVKDVFWGRLDYLLFDLPPGTSDEHLTSTKVLKSVKLKGVLLVTTPHKLAKDTMCKCVDFCRKVDVPVIGVIENMSLYKCPCCGETTEIYPDGGVSEVLEREMGVQMLGKLPFEDKLSELGEDKLLEEDSIKKIVEYVQPICKYIS